MSDPLFEEVEDSTPLSEHEKQQLNPILLYAPN